MHTMQDEELSSPGDDKSTAKKSRGGGSLIVDVSLVRPTIA